MRNIIVNMVSLLLVVSSSLTYAVNVNSIYKAEIPVASHSEKDKKAAITAGLAQVFVKVSGNMHIVEKNLSLQSNLKEADTAVKELNYTNLPGDAQASLLDINFDPDKVNKMLQDAGATIWAQSRPLILAWIVLDTPSHPADIVDGSTPSELQTALKHATKQRGLAVILPSMDASEISQVSADDVTKKSVETLVKISKRYNSNDLLIGNVSEDDDGFSSDWLFVSGGERQRWNISGTKLEDILTNLSNNIADLLSSNYTNTLTDTVQAQLSLKIKQVTKQAQLISLMKTLQALPTVIDVKLETVANDEVNFNVSLRGSKQAFIQALANQKSLKSVSANLLDDDTLIYTLSN
jgi:hypothetical protein